ncbi:MAG: alpha-2-macroglobulin family protein, partial [Desulfovibrio sp.]
SVSGTIALPKAGPGKGLFPVLDAAPLLQGDGDHRGLMNIEITGWAGGKKAAFASRLLLITDIGLTLKSEGDGSTVAFVQDLSSGKPMQGVEVSLLGVNGLPLISGKSDAGGMVRLASVTGLSAEQKPVAVIASSGRDLAWLSLQESSRKLDMSAFDVNGRHCEADGLLASVFSQRGLYMPGETLHFGALVRRFDWEPLPKGLPLEATLTSPTGATVLRKPVKVEPDGLVELAWQSPLDAPAGTYRLDISLPSAQAVLGSATARVEEFEPDTMAMKASLSPALPKGWIRTGQGAGKVEAQVLLSTLYGSSAAGHRIQASFEASPARLGFSSKPDYTFYDATPPLSEERSIPIDEMFTGKDGSASFALPYEGIGGSFRGTVRIDGFEAAGGRAVTRQIDAMFSPLEAVVGYKPTGEANNLDYIAKGAKAGLHVIALDNDLAPAALDGVTATFSSRRYVNSLVTDTRGEYRYDSTPVDEAIATKPAPIGKDGASIDLPSDTPGDYLLTLTGSKGETLAVIPFSVAGDKLKDPQLSGSSQSLAGGSLRLRLENASCEPGGTLTFTLSAPYAGSGLITIEREKVVASKWFTAKAGETTQQITVPEGFEGRGYVCVSFSRSADSDAIYMKPHAYAAAPFNCGLARRDMGLAIDAPQTILPGANMHVSLSAKRPGRALLFAVDEGVLSLTGFRTPAPLNDLLADRALDVVTRQAFDLLMPDHARLRGRIPAFGGDMGNPGGRFLNPFRRRSEPPFALWQGAVDLSSGKAELDIPVPSYLSGKIRIMAVGSSLDNGMLTAGSAESMTTVRGTVILRPLLPLAAAPEDTFEGALTVANTIKGSGKSLPVRIKIAPDAGITLVNTQLEQVVNVDEEGEAVIPFHAKVSDKLGSSGITFTAESDKLPGGAAVVREQTLSIRPPVPRMRREEMQPVKNSVNIRSIRDMYPFEQKSTLTVASAEHLAMRSLAARLGTYPYGCTEQLISRAFPYAASLNDAAMLDLFQSGKGMDPAKMRRERERALLTAVEAIERCFNGYQVSLWSGSEGDPFVTAYAADFLLTLRENGRAVPENLLRRILNTLESQSGNDPYNAGDARIKAYACWLLLRDGRVVTQHVDNLEKWLDENAEGWKGDVTAALLADSNAMLRRSSRARKLMPAPLHASGEGYAGSMLTKGAAVGLYHAVIARPFWQDAQRADMDELRDAALNPHATTTEMALTGRALASLASASPASDAVALSCTEPSGIGKAQALGSILELDAPGCRKFHLEVKDASRVENLSWILATDGFDHDVPDTISNGMELKRRYLDSKGQEAASARIGEVLTVELTVSAGTPVKNVVLVDLLPGGLEPVLERDGEAPSADGLVRFERREDRGIFFINLEGDAAQTYTYRVRAVTAGKFIVPAATAEAMYAPDRNATTGGGYMDIAQ